MYSPTTIGSSSTIESFNPLGGASSSVDSTIIGDFALTTILVDNDGNVIDDEDDGSGNLDGGTTTYMASLDPDTGSYKYATVNSTHVAKVTTNVPYYYVRWFVKPPDDTSERGIEIKTDSGDGTTLTEASLSYTFPTGVTGDYTITALIREGADVSTRELSYDIRVTLSPGLRPINGSSYYANSGDTYEMGLITDAPYSEVRWSVSPPGDTSTDGTVVETNTDEGTTTEAEFSYSLPSGAPGFRRITAHIFRADGSDYKVTYDVYVY